MLQTIDVTKGSSWDHMLYCDAFAYSTLKKLQVEYSTFYMPISKRHRHQ